MVQKSNELIVRNLCYRRTEGHAGGWVKLDSKDPPVEVEHQKLRIKSLMTGNYNKNLPKPKTGG